ncbi:adhesion G protein-coupled receptor L2-like [Palaemon carinicauda]|uniref:adhesion G protein-coupled receptor L2-like n=1 Tax=Palaemon carinicauda TaxID=392227 RepID=UPI0035B68034
MERVEKEMENGTTAAKILAIAADELSKDELLPRAVLHAGKLLNNLIIIHEDNLSKAKNQDEGQKLARKFLEAAAEVAENTMKNSSVWKDLQENELASTLTNIQKSLDDATNMYADYLHYETKNIPHENIAIIASSQPTIHFNNPEKRIFKSPYDDHTRITLPRKFYKGYRNQNSTIKAIFMAYKNLGCTRNTIPCSPPETTLQDLSAKSQINSAIIGAMVGNASTWYASAGEYVKVHLEHNYKGDNYELGEGTCVWWNVSSNNWDSQGCTRNVTNADYTVCHCNHLTNFAVIMDIKGILQKNSEWYKHLQLITIIGSIMSIFSLSLYIMFFAGFRQTPQGKREKCTFSRLNLCICLLLTKSVLLGGLDRTSNVILCTVVAISLHYLFLATFTWSAIEAFQLYKNFITVFKKDGSRKKTFLAMGYLGPMIVVAMTFTFTKPLESDINGTPTV